MKGLWKSSSEDLYLQKPSTVWHEETHTSFYFTISILIPVKWRDWEKASSFLSSSFMVVNSFILTWKGATAEGLPPSVHSQFTLLCLCPPGTHENKDNSPLQAPLPDEATILLTGCPRLCTEKCPFLCKQGLLLQISEKGWFLSAAKENNHSQLAIERRVFASPQIYSWPSG